MQPLNFFQLQELSKHLHELLEGALLQEVKLTANLLELRFWKKGDIYLEVLLNQTHPLVSMSFLPLIKGKGIVKPLFLFLKAHFVNKKVSRILVRAEYGRLLEIHFACPDCTYMAISLIRGRFNLQLFAGKKMLSWLKPKDLKKQNAEEVAQSILGKEKFNFDDYLKEFSNFFAKLKKPTTKQIPGQNLDFKLEKNQFLIEKLQKELERHQSISWDEMALWIKTEQSTQVPDAWTQYFRGVKGQDIASYLEHIFQKRKKSEQAIVGLKERIEKLSQAPQVANGIGSHRQEPISTAEVNPGSALLNRAHAKGRSYLLNSGRMFLLGKTAIDNMALLKYAKPWYLWLHLRDYPSSFGILVKAKRDIVGQAEIFEAAQHLVKKSQNKLMVGDRYALVYCECRFVRPIKGDKKGRVTYHSALHLDFQVKTEVL